MKQIHYFLISVALTLICFCATCVLIDSKIPEYETVIEPHFNTEHTKDYFYFTATTRTRDGLALRYNVTVVANYGYQGKDVCDALHHDCRLTTPIKTAFINSGYQILVTKANKLDSVFQAQLSGLQIQWTNIILQPTEETVHLLQTIDKLEANKIQAEAQVYVSKKQLELAKQAAYLKSIENLHKSITNNQNP